MSYRHCTVRLTPEHYARVEHIAKSGGYSPAEVIRRAVDQYLLGHKLIQDSQLRHVKIAEYSQAALDTIIAEQHPEFRDRIIAETTRRMERHHGAR